MRNDAGLEIQVHLVIELAWHEQMYLDNDYLAKGRPDAQDVAGCCNICSEQYVSSRHEEVDVSATFQLETVFYC